MSTNYLHSLKTKQLLAILKQVQYGHAHLLRKLGKREYNNLLAIGALSNNQLSKIESDKQEKIGNVSVVVNTILTSCFGAWLGFSGFRHTEVVSTGGALIIVLALFFGLLSGYLSYIFTFRQEKLALHTQKIYNVRRILTEIIITKRQAKIEKIKKKVIALLSLMDLIDESISDNSSKRIFDSITKIMSPNNHFDYLYKKIHFNLLNNMAKLSDYKISSVQSDAKYNSTDFLLNNSLTNASYIRILTKSEDVTHNKIPKVHHWLRKNVTGIAVGLLPTFLGTFASMFVFLNGFPTLINQLHMELGLSSGAIASIKSAGIVIAMLITLYFSYSHIHSNYKSYKRAKLLELSETQIAKKTTEMVHLMAEINVWYKILFQIELLEIIHNYSSDSLPKSSEKTSLFC